jgi:hypothetical protein
MIPENNEATTLYSMHYIKMKIKQKY